MAKKDIKKKRGRYDPDERFSGRDIGKIVLFLGPFMVGIIIFTIYPFINAFLMSFKENYSVLRNTFSGWGIGNYVKVMNDDVFRSALITTVKYVFIVVPISVIISVIIAVMLNNVKRFQAILQTAYFMPLVTSTAAISLVFRFLFANEGGLINQIIMTMGSERINFLGTNKWSEIVLYIFGIWNTLPFTIILLLAGIQNIDPQYYTAAKVDGAKTVDIFLNITVPLLSPTIALVAIVNSISAFKVFDYVFQLFNKPGPGYNLYTMIYYIYEKFGGTKPQYGYAAAASIILFFVIAVFTLLQRSLQKHTNY
ncbi:MAG: sugar ABC transporter permease [Erysipelotrichaceae bacterium]|nr:sugar ABC transporter permease [Erysipelotrichaceae bacterium]